MVKVCRIVSPPLSLETCESRKLQSGLLLNFEGNDEQDVNTLRDCLARVTDDRDNLKAKVQSLEEELTRVRDECGTLTRRCKELENEKQEVSMLIEQNFSLSQGMFRRNLLLERKLLEHASETDDAQQRGVADRRAEADKARIDSSAHLSRTEEWVVMHRAIQMEYSHRPEVEGSAGGTSGSDTYDGDPAYHLNPDDSASNEGAFQKVAIGSHRDLEVDAKGISNLERMLDVSKRMCTGAQRSKADKVARSPWKTSVDVNPVFASQMLFGGLIRGLAAKAAAGGVSEDALSREAFY